MKYKNSEDVLKEIRKLDNARFDSSVVPLILPKAINRELKQRSLI